MGCDGIWEKWSNDEMVEWVYERFNKLDKKNIKEESLKEIVDELLNTIISPNF
jgi:serine/threonine protein phosphatase PrpC